MPRATRTAPPSVRPSRCSTERSLSPIAPNFAWKRLLIVRLPPPSLPPTSPHTEKIREQCTDWIHVVSVHNQSDTQMFSFDFPSVEEKAARPIDFRKKVNKVKVITPTVESCITQVGYRRSQISKDKVSKVKVFILQ